MSMKTLCVLQHVEAEYLGLVEDHLESRSIRFNYCRPFVPGGRVPKEAGDFDGLILLGAGPFGVVSGPLLPSLAAELRLTEDFLKNRLPVIGIGLGAALLTVAAGGGAAEAPLRFSVDTARRTSPGALGGYMPDRFPVAIYMRDRPVLPEDASVLARDEAGEPVVFGIGDTAIGFLGHPGIKSAMIEDMIMEFDEAAEGTAEGLPQLRAVQGGIAEALTMMMVGIVQQARWMTPAAKATGNV
jgi:GMP synthase-like glutamine amidotransferase